MSDARQQGKGPSGRLRLQDLDSGRSIELCPPVLLGRAKDADIRIDDRSVSRRHARIGEAGGLFFVEDLGSANGTFVNGRRVSDRFFLSDGDILQLGSKRFSCTVHSDGDDLFRETVILESVPSLKRPELDSLRLSFLYELARKMAETRELTALAQEFFKGLGRLMEFDRAILALLDRQNRLQAVFPAGVERLPVSRTIAERVLTSGQALLLQDAMSDQELGAQESIVALRVRSALCVPLSTTEKTLGIIYLDRAIAGGFSSSDMDLVRACAAILGPLAENVQLRQELERALKKTRQDLEATQARLLNMERRAVFARLAQAVAHEIRNPVMIAGGLLQRLRPADEKEMDRKKRALDALIRVDRVLREVDSFVSQPALRKGLTKIALLLQDFVSGAKGRYPMLELELHLPEDAPHLLVRLDEERFKKALDLILSDINARSQKGVALPLRLLSEGANVAIFMGDEEKRALLRDPFSQEVDRRPWRFGLFLNMASKIVADHEGRLRLNPDDPLSLPIEILLPV